MTAGNGKTGQPARFVLSDRQRLAWLRLYRSDNVGPATFRDLITHCGSAELALSSENSASLFRRDGRIRKVAVDNGEVSVFADFDRTQ